MSMAPYDAIVIGAGHNGLVTALYLARAGWHTLVLERNERVGGAVMSGDVTLPGFTSDLYATNMNLFLASPVYQEFRDDLLRHGLLFRTCSRPYCNVFPDGTSLRVYQDRERTLEGLRRHNPRDADGWATLYARYQTFKRTLLPLYDTPLPSLAAGWTLAQAARTIGLEEMSEMAQIILSSTRELGESYFATEEARALVASWGMHLDFGPDVSGGGMFPFIEALGDMEAGISIVQGGASHLAEGLAALVREQGGEVRTNAPVVRVLTDGARVTGVELNTGERLFARHAIVANLTPTVLFEHLLRDAALPDAFRRKVQRYAYGPGTMMIHLALSSPPFWAAGGDLHEFAYVHIPPYVEDLARTYTAAINGFLPESPFVIVGQTSAVDPTRAPRDQALLWIQVRTLPSHIRGDAAGEIMARDWDEAKEPFADRVIQKLEAYAPGIANLILARTVFSPLDLQRHDPTLHGGDSVGGSHHLRQNFLFRPFAGWSTYRMPLENLYLTGAATWPGAGVNAVSGYLAAQEILRPQATRKRLLREGAAVGAAVGGVAAAAALAARRLGDHR